MDVTYQEESRFVWARIPGTWTVDQICAVAPAVLAECLARKQDLLMIDLSGLSPQGVTLLDRYKLGSSIIPFGGKLRKVAALGQPSFIDPQKFGEQVARNRGVNVRVFGDRGEAERWLLEKD